MPRLTEYLLKLATDAAELQKYRDIREHPEKAVNYLTEDPTPGLTVEQAEIILGHDSQLVIAAVMEELKEESSRPETPFYGIAVSIVCEVNNHVMHHYLTEA